MKIARFFMIAAIALSSFIVKAQDTLLMKSGQKIASQISEVSPSAVRYKKADNPDGPVYVVNTSDIYAIKYRNGAMDTIKTAEAAAPVVVKIPSATPVAAKMAVDPNPPITPAGFHKYRYGNRRIGENEMYEVLQNMNDPEINLHVKKARIGKGMEYVGFLAIPAFIFCVAYTGAAHISKGSGEPGFPYTPGIVAGVVGMGALATCITFKITGSNHHNTAIKLYNEKY